MKQISGKDFCKLLESLGWTLKRVSGSHHIFVKEGKRERIVVPVNGNKPLKLGLLKAQMKIADIQDSESKHINKALHWTAIPLRSIAANEL